LISHRHAPDKDRREIAVLLEKSLPLILHTKEGSRIAIYCINYGNAKVSLKEITQKIESKEFFIHFSSYVERTESKEYN
jgi:hypothetical protein